MKYIKLLAMASLLMAVAGTTRADLQAGDITIIGYRADANDGLAFVTWQDIAGLTSIYFTDAGFFAGGTMRTSEDIMSWTAPAGGVSAGSVVVLTCPNGLSSANIGTTAGQLDGISASGDQLFAGLSAFPDGGDTSEPGETYVGTLLYGFSLNGGWLAAGTPSSNTSYLPGALDGEHLNLAVAHVDNGQYTGARTGMDVDGFRVAIHDTDNWTFHDDGAVFGALDTTPFAPVPEPGTMALLGLGLAGVWARRRQARG